MIALLIVVLYIIIGGCCSVPLAKWTWHRIKKTADTRYNYTADPGGVYATILFTVLLWPIVYPIYAIGSRVVDEEYFQDVPSARDTVKKVMKGKSSQPRPASDDGQPEEPTLR